MVKKIDLCQPLSIPHLILTQNYAWVYKQTFTVYYIIMKL